MKKRAVLLIVTVVLINCSLLQANPADFNKDGRVNCLDLAIFIQSWLWTVQPDDMVWVYVNDPGLAGHDGFTGEMSKYEITNAQYCQFLNAAFSSGDIDVNTVGLDTVIGVSGYNAGADYVDEPYYNLDGQGVTMAGATKGGAARINYDYESGEFSVDPNFEHHPVTYVSWYGARAFCNYYLYKLPTKWQWRAVADYDGTYLYGCGPNINIYLANYKDSIHPYGTKNVGMYGAFGWSMCDMAGNVFEWTDSCEEGGHCNPGDRMIMCDGGWNVGKEICQVSKTVIVYPYSFECNIGFRVCR